MAEKIEIYKRLVLESLLSKIRNSSDLSDENKLAILEFADDLLSEGLSDHRIVKYCHFLKYIARHLGKSFSSATKKDLQKLLLKIERTDYAEWTKHEFKVTLKRFYRWMRKTEDYPAEVSWIKTTIRNRNSKLPEELLTEQEVKKAIETCDHPRDKALIAVLWESGARIGEVLTLRIKHVQLDQYGAFLILNGKTGMRRVRIISSAPYLTSWLNLHPSKDNVASPLWVELRQKAHSDVRQAVNYSNACLRVKKIFKKAGIKKRIYPHLLRHSRATFLARHLTDAQMKQYLGWVQGSDMASIYVHMSARDVDDALLKLYGVKSDVATDHESLLKPITCMRCQEVNPATFRFCGKCSSPLTITTAIQLDETRKKYDDLLSRLISDPEVMAVLTEKIRRLNQG